MAYVKGILESVPCFLRSPYALGSKPLGVCLSCTYADESMDILSLLLKERRENIQLKVYKENDKAVHFYVMNGFIIKEALLDEQTGKEEFLMEWEKV